MNESVGKNFPPSEGAPEGDTRSASDARVRLLVVDDVIGSRFSLVQAASRDDRIVDAVSSSEAARRLLSAHRYALVLVDEALEDASGLAFLEVLHRDFPHVARALVATDQSLAAKRESIARADLAFLLTRPWSPSALARTLHAFFGEPAPAVAPADPVVVRTGRAAQWRTLSEATADGATGEVLARGLLAGLNACVDREGIVALLRHEMESTLGFDRWLLRTASDQVVVFDDASPEGMPIATSEVGAELVARLEELAAGSRCAEPVVIRSVGRVAGQEWVGVRLPGRAGEPGLVSIAGGRAGGVSAAIALLRAVEGGLAMALERIALADRRSRAAHRLARRVSLALRARLGDLAHAIDGLRNEAAEIGLSPQSMERIRSESERMAQAVEYVEDEILGVDPGASAPPG